VKHVGYLIKKAGEPTQFSQWPLTEADKRAGYTQQKCYVEENKT
jgi:hypothetical protein